MDVWDAFVSGGQRAVQAMHFGDAAEGELAAPPDEGALADAMGPRIIAAYVDQAIQWTPVLWAAALAQRRALGRILNDEDLALLARSEAGDDANR